MESAHRWTVVVVQPKEPFVCDSDDPVRDPGDRTRMDSKMDQMIFVKSSAKGGGGCSQRKKTRSWSKLQFVLPTCANSFYYTQSSTLIRTHLHPPSTVIHTHPPISIALSQMATVRWSKDSGWMRTSWEQIWVVSDEMCVDALV